MIDWQEPTQNVEVSSTGSGEQFNTVIRYAATSATGYLLGAGYINGEVQQALITIAGIVAPLVWGWIATRKNAKLKADVAIGDKTLSLKGGQ